METALLARQQRLEVGAVQLIVQNVQGQTNAPSRPSTRSALQLSTHFFFLRLTPAPQQVGVGLVDEVKGAKAWGHESLGSVRLGKVVYSSGCESRSSKAGQPLDRELWVGGSNSKD